MKIILALLATMFCISAVSAHSYIYHVQGQHNNVFITLNDNGSGHATDGERTLDFTWDKNYIAHYWFWSVPFVMSGDKLTSPSFPNDVAVLVATRN